jgi:membrane-bound lytic murein transglycosylase D
MIRILLVLILPLILKANFNFNDNYEKQATILRKFDVDSTFLNDKFLLEMLHEYKTETKKLLFFRAMSESVLFLPTIKKMLSDSKIPNEFLYLAMAESRLISGAVSTKQAAGIWQFMPSTAQLYGLRVDRFIDERLDMIKSTKVAIKFLSDMYQRFEKWYLAAIAYNCGEGTLSKAIKKAGTDDLSVLIDPEKKYLPKESRIYIRKILALALLEGSDEVFISKESYIFNIGGNSSLATIKIGGGERLEDIAKTVDMSLEEIAILNSHIIFQITPFDENEYSIYIPYFKLAQFRANYKKKRILKGEIEYIVKKGDSLYKIGSLYNCNYENIKIANGIDGDHLYVGQKLKIPILYDNGKFEKEEPVLSSYVEKSSEELQYQVKKGDTLYSIAREFRVDITSLMEMNNLKSANIYIGEHLIVK